MTTATENKNITDTNTRTALVVAGKAIFTLTSTATGKHFTYKVSAKDVKDGDGNPSTLYFASVLTGPDNWSNYTYAGMITPVFASDGSGEVAILSFRRTNGSKISGDALSVKALDWFCRNPGAPSVEFRHEGKCCRCGRKLTDDVSIDAGLGPVCRKEA